MAWRLEISKFFIDQGYAVRRVLRATGVSSSTWYYHQSDRKPKLGKRGRPIPGYTKNPDGSLVIDSTVVSLLRDYRSQIEFANGGGYHKLKHYIRRDYGYFINHKKLYRLCREHNLLLPRHRKKVRRRKRISINRVIDGPNQLWEFDIKYGYIQGQNRFFYVLTFIDVFLRKVINYHVGLTCKGKDLKLTLDRALKIATGDKSNLVIRSDNGTQMTSNMFRNYIDDIGLEHEYIPAGCPNKNAHVESFFSILETEFMQVRYFRDFGDAYKKTVGFMEHYNARRIHGSLNNFAPRDAESAFYAGELKIKEVRV